MRYILAAAIAVMMVMDYYLTIAGNRLRHRAEHHKHVIVENYELNPRWQQDVASGRRFNFWHLAWVVIAMMVLLGVAFLAEGTLTPRGSPWDVALGSIGIVTAIISGRHLMNLLYYGYVEKHRQSLSGELRISSSLSLRQSTYIYWVAWVPLLVAFFFQPSYFLGGALIGPLVMAWVTLRWERKVAISLPAGEAEEGCEREGR